MGTCSILGRLPLTITFLLVGAFAIPQACALVGSLSPVICFGIVGCVALAISLPIVRRSAIASSRAIVVSHALIIT